MPVRLPRVAPSALGNASIASSRHAPAARVSLPALWDGEAVPAGGLTQRVAAATAGRDRVLDAVKVFALLVVIVAHAFAWQVDDGEASNVLDSRPEYAGLTWGLQILALFFAAGAVSNARSLHRAESTAVWLGHRLERLLGPVLVYSLVLATVLLPLTVLLGDAVIGIGVFLGQLLWFVGIYLVVVAAAPWTTDYRSVRLLAAWLAVIAVVDVVRLTVVPAAGWLNMLLAWGWLHQVGYRWPELRALPKPRLLVGAAVAMAAALTLAYLGPYSNAMVSFGGDSEASNLAPPTVVLALHGLALILVVAALWPLLERALASPRLWTPVAVLGARGMGLYLWHIPVVGTAAGIFVILGDSPQPFDWAWWTVHVATAAVAIGGAWLLAGAAAQPERALRRIPATHQQSAATAAAITAISGALVLLLSVTGLGTWWTTEFLGLPASAPVILALLLVLWRLRCLGRNASKRGASG